LHHYLRTLEELLIELLGTYGIQAQRRDGLTGAWVENRKIASIGVGVRRWITMHGFALNISSDLSGFDAITPCGISGVEMTSVSREVQNEISVAECAERCGSLFAKELLYRLH
jgi:lipoyl(octanoyl) transferase